MSLQPPSGFESTPQPATTARRVPAPRPHGIKVIGGISAHLHRVIALDAMASNIGYLTVEWSLRQNGFDLLALSENATVAARGTSLAVDLAGPLGRVLIATGSRGTMPMPASELRLTNGSTRVTVPIEGGTSLGMWPRLSLTRVDGYLVVRHEHDLLSGVLGAVAGAYGYDERQFTLAHTT